MKTKLHKSLLFLLVTVFAFQVQGQVGPLDGDGYGLFSTASQGTWKVKLKDQVGGETLFLTVNSSNKVVWAAEISGDDPTQLWVFTEHSLSVANFYITSAVSGLGVMKADVTTDDTPDLIVGAAGTQDQWQMRKMANVEADYATNGDLPGQNAIFLADDNADTPWSTATSSVRLGITPVKDATIELDGSAYAMRFKLISVLSTEEFDTSAFAMSNLVSDQLTIQGLPSNVKQIAVYSLLGQKLITKEVSSESLNVNVSSLKTGMYIVDFIGENGRFTKKIIKQ